LPLSLQADGTYEYDSRKSGQPDVFLGEPRLAFFPLDDGGPYATPFGNQGAPHNFAFTAELHVTFLASAGSTLQVRADDDLYVFIDRKLAIDLGGNRAAIEKLLSLDDLALTSNEPYPLDIFYAERQGATGELMLRTNVRLLPAP
jgi:fibro-slime domain-containing protein